MEIEGYYKKIKTTAAFLRGICIGALFLRECVICGNDIESSGNDHLCGKCISEIKKDMTNRCLICGTALPGGSSICGQCNIARPPFDRHVSYSIYRDKLRKLILQYKISGIEPLKKFIAGLYIKTLKEDLKEEFDIIVPVPSDPGRRKNFEPVAGIAACISKEIGAGLSLRNLVKKTHTEKQTSLNYINRIKNLNGAYGISDESRFAGKKILLVDDVFTTGTTVKICSELLKKNAAKVYAVTLARSVDINPEQG